MLPGGGGYAESLTCSHFIVSSENQNNIKIQTFTVAFIFLPFGVMGFIWEL